jgi:Cu/Ag efflux protein CusF
MNSRQTFLFLALSALAGCAAYQIEPLGLNHPAHLDATAAPERPTSKTLAYTRSNLPSAREITNLATTERGEHESHHQSEPTAPQTAVGEGMVVATVPSANQIVVEHGKIEGFMDSMTMGYQVEPSSLLKELKSGDKIRFTIDVPKKTIVKIEKLR